MNVDLKLKVRICRRRLLLAVIVVLGLGVGLPLGLSAEAAEGSDVLAFNHAKTGFPLTGAHVRARCESCHVQGVFRATPRQCMFCHTRGGRIVAMAKPANHIPTRGDCGSCHRTTAWTPAIFSHAAVTPGTCATCHNGTTATGKPANHIPTTASCDSCHRTTAWLPATFNHTGVTPGTCATCHNGGTATGKPANHIPTTASCDSCHRTTAWLPATFDHTGVTPGTCATCHNGTTATGKPGNHFVTAQSCDACHRTTAWTPLNVYVHKTPFYKPHNAAVTCISCHTNNNEVIAWPFAAYKPDCAGCHAGDFKQGAHKKVDTPKILYTVSELRDCAGSCHIYTDTSLTTILKARTGKHRSTDGGF